ncbi:hypothetical protein N0V93_004300 [Gnomoniopsis smithogilvyi]|uniref:Esterase n=1 Tax=Gnomoniopsis smithogilvyi TaxID=1191159 RepID=A0A9W8YUF8_9PEZI|nr:hypothetical protein N0V93_004300 [Gnomoniopsis smithogilvyi]
MALTWSTPAVWLTALVVLASASVTVRKTSQGPTGYEVDFTYVNSSAQSVVIGGGIQTFTDQFHTSPQYSAGYNPQNYKPGDFFVNLFTAVSDVPWPYVMEHTGNGTWTFTTPLPSGTYNYGFLVDCPLANCTTTSEQYFFDPDNPPFVNIPGDQLASTFQVPYDDEFQNYKAMDLNFDFALPVSQDKQGTVKSVNYTSPGSTSPAPDVHDFVLYLPAEYGTIQGKEYPVLYLSHGGGGNAQDWENLAKASHILDNLIADGHIEPTVVVMPNFYHITSDDSLMPVPSAARENYMEYLFPFVEATYAVSNSSSRRAFAGLSLGGILTYEMYINATSYFDYFGIFSGALGPTANASQYLNAEQLAANPSLANKGVFVGFGLFDIAFDDCRLLQAALDGLDIQHVSWVAPYGSHFWNTWQNALWLFGVTSMWKDLPFTPETGHAPNIY